MRPEGSALGLRPEGSALGVRPEGSALGVRPEGSALGVRLKKRHSALLLDAGGIESSIIRMFNHLQPLKTLFSIIMKDRV
ncbi:MAG: hypothetical protein ABW201_13490 [Candidatus Thiodiazotropha sp.]